MIKLITHLIIVTVLCSCGRSFDDDPKPYYSKFFQKTITSDDMEFVMYPEGVLEKHKCEILNPNDEQVRIIACPAFTESWIAHIKPGRIIGMIDGKRCEWVDAELIANTLDLDPMMLEERQRIGLDGVYYFVEICSGGKYTQTWIWSPDLDSDIGLMMEQFNNHLTSACSGRLRRR